MEHMDFTNKTAVVTGGANAARTNCNIQSVAWGVRWTLPK